MTHRTCPKFELLEARSLLSALAYSLTTDKPVYQPGQLVHMTFTETNTSNQPVTVDYGPSGDGFEVEQNGSVVWESNAGINPFVIVARTLQPGESLTLSATWDGVPNTSRSTVLEGTFQVVNQLNPQAAGATFRIGGTADPPADPPAPGESPLDATLITNRPAYRLGQHVHMVLTLTNTSDQAVSLAALSAADGFTSSRGNLVVWHKGIPARDAAPQALLPGQTLTLRATWNGRPNQPAVQEATPGVYTIQAQLGVASPSTTIRIGN